MTEALLAVRDLKTYFHTDSGIVRAVDGVSFHIDPGEIFAIVGESGSGKSITALSILGLIPMPPGRVESGTIMWQGRDLLQCTEDEMRRVRGGEIAMVFQDPLSALNPVYTVGYQIEEMILNHTSLSKSQARAKTIEMLELVEIPKPQSVVVQILQLLSNFVNRLPKNSNFNAKRFHFSRERFLFSFRCRNRCFPASNHEYMVPQMRRSRKG